VIQYPDDDHSECNDALHKGESRAVMAGYQCRVCGKRFITGEDCIVLMAHHEQEHPNVGIVRFDPI